MNNACHKNIWCANAMVGAGMISGACDNHYHKENFKHDAAHMYASGSGPASAPTPVHRSCDGLKIGKCADVGTEDHCKKTARLINPGHGYAQCRYHKGHCKNAKGSGYDCVADCQPEIVSYDVNANYEMGTAPNGQEYEKRGSIQSFSNGEYKKCTDQAKMFPTLTDDAKAFQCYAMYQWTNGEPPEAGDDPTIDLCVWDGDNKQCVADPDYSNILFTESAVQDLNCSY